MCDWIEKLQRRGFQLPWIATIVDADGHGVVYRYALVTDDDHPDSDEVEDVVEIEPLMGTSKPYQQVREQAPAVSVTVVNSTGQVATARFETRNARRCQHARH